VLGITAGCGDDTGAARVSVYPVKGQVLLPDGKPLGVGSVEFIGTKGAMMSVQGKLNSDGSFTLGSPDTRVGAPAGEYRVRIVADPAQYAHSTKGDVLDRSKLGFSSKYLDENTSGLTAVVKSGDNQLEPFRLTKADGTEAGDPRFNRRSND
jgi:hypothetical protein